MDLGFANDVIEILDYIGKKFGIAIDWSANTVLPYLQELGQKYIAYRISVATMWIVILSIGMLVCTAIVLVINHLAKKEKCNLDDQDAAWWVRGISFILIFVLLGISFYHVYIIIECRTFPEKVLFEYVKTLYTTGIGN